MGAKFYLNLGMSLNKQLVGSPWYNSNYDPGQLMFKKKIRTDIQFQCVFSVDLDHLVYWIIGISRVSIYNIYQKINFIAQEDIFYFKLSTIVLQNFSIYTRFSKTLIVQLF